MATLICHRIQGKELRYKMSEHHHLNKNSSVHFCMVLCGL
jgi:hypothetical protein